MAENDPANSIIETTTLLVRRANEILDKAIENLVDSGTAPESCMVLNMPDEGRKLAWRVLCVFELPVYEVFVERNLDSMQFSAVGMPIDPLSELAKRILRDLAREREADKPRIIVPR